MSGRSGRVEEKGRTPKGRVQGIPNGRLGESEVE
jgi:hypothetical protein